MTQCTVKSRFIKSLSSITCVLCGCGEAWNGSRITLELDHIDGNNTNNDFRNLRLLCPNCHSQQPTTNRKKGVSDYRTRRIKESEVIDLANRGKNIRQILVTLGFSDTGANYKRVKSILNMNGVGLAMKSVFDRKPDRRDIGGPRPHIRKVVWPSRDELVILVEKEPSTKIGMRFGVSGNAVAKWCKIYCVTPKPRGYWAKIYAQENILRSSRSVGTMPTSFNG